MLVFWEVSAELVKNKETIRNEGRRSLATNMNQRLRRYYKTNGTRAQAHIKGEREKRRESGWSRGDEGEMSESAGGREGGWKS